MIEGAALAHLQRLLDTQDSRDASVHLNQGAELTNLRSFMHWPAFLTRAGDPKTLKGSLSSHTLSRTTPTPKVKSP
jgi:hypothetical protein